MTNDSHEHRITKLEHTDDLIGEWRKQSDNNMSELVRKIEDLTVKIEALSISIAKSANMSDDLRELQHEVRANSQFRLSNEPLIKFVWGIVITAAGIIVAAIVGLIINRP